MAFGIDDAIAAGSKLIDDIVTRIWPDATEIEKAKLDQLSAEIQNQYNVVLGQLAINQEEAKSSNWFVAGGRPAAIWVGVLSLAYSGIGISIGTWISACFGLPPLPIVDPTTQTNLLYALLGVGGLRTIDKIKGVDTKKIGR